MHKVGGGEVDDGTFAKNAASTVYVATCECVRPDARACSPVGMSRKMHSRVTQVLILPITDLMILF